METSKIYHGGGPLGRNRFSSSVVGPDIKAKVSGADTTSGFLNPKIAPGSGIATAILNPGANEQLEISAPGSTTDEKTKVSVADTTADFLVGKVAFVNLSAIILNPGGDETLQVTAQAPPFSLVTVNDSIPDYLDSKIVVLDDLVKTVLNPSGNEQLQLKSNGKARCTVNDTTFNYLQQKVVAGSNVTVTLLNPAGNESLSIASVGGGAPLYCMNFDYAGALATNVLIPAPDGVWAGNGQGYYATRNLVLKEIWALINRLVSFTTGTLTVNIRYVEGDGSRTTVITGPSGTSLNTLVINCPNSGGSFRYYCGNGVTGLSNNVDAGNMIFCRISGKTVNSATGITVLTFWEAG